MEEISKEEAAALLRKVISSVEQLTKKGQKISLDCQLNNSIRIDKKLTGNLLSNLLSNAIKFSPEHSEIFVKCRSGSSQFEISVKDSGIGISEEDQRHLFERFFRAKNASHIQGTGLGLNIVLKYIELMKGKISFDSEINEGTTFVVQIPQ